MANASHGVFVSRQKTSVSTPVVAATGIPFVVGLAPVQSAENPVPAGVPVVCSNWDDVVEKLGYSDDWDTYTLCEFAYSHFKLFNCQPVVFCNVLDISKMKKAGSKTDITIEDHRVKLPIATLNDETLIIKSSEDAALVKDSDYSSYYDGEYLIIELLSESEHYNDETVKAEYTEVDPTKVSAVEIAAAMESIELCLTTFGIIPDLLCAPGYSHISTVAAVMATKADSINGLFKAKALIDIDSSEEGAQSYLDVLDVKNSNNFVDTNEIVCWPMIKRGNQIFHLSTQLAGLIAQVDSDNDGNPYESPSNKKIQCDSLVLADGTEVNLTFTQANVLNSYGVVTALNFINGWTCWGNYTACYPLNTINAEDFFIPVSRTVDWVGKTLILTFWEKLDKPMTRRLIDTILTTANLWLNGLVGSEYLLGARIEMLEEENPTENLIAGIIKLHIYLAPPSPMQEVNFVLEYDANYVSSALV